MPDKKACNRFLHLAMETALVKCEHTYKARAKYCMEAPGGHGATNFLPI